MAGDDSSDWGPPDEDELDDWGSFYLPPPPPPPGPTACEDLFCRAGGGPMGAAFDRAAAFPSLPIVAVCSSVVFVAVLVASFLFWRHKSKVQNLLPSKSEQQGELGAANGVTYEDILAGHHPSRMTQGHLAGSQTLMPLEILDVKLGDLGPPHITAMHHAPCYPPSRDPVHMKPFHHPVYEEVSQTPTGNLRQPADKLGDMRPSLTSDEDFAEEDQCSATSSVRGSTGGDLCRDPVSSDGEDCESYMINNLPKVENSFGYNPRHNKNHHQQTYPERTAPVQRVTEPAYRSHSSNHKPNNCGRMVSPSHIPSSTFGSRAVDPRSAQWVTGHGQYQQQQQHQQDGFSASQENIYSTIDEDEDYPAPLTSLACTQRGGSTPPGKSPMGKGTHATRVDGRPIPPPLSQRKPEENGGSSYGDIMPAFHSASFM